jgi:hypothetical protein
MAWGDFLKSKIVGLKRLHSILGMLLALSPLWGATIQVVEFRGLKGTSPQVLERWLQQRAGSEFDSLQLAHDQDLLMSLDLFAEVQAEIQGDTLRWIVKPLPKGLILPALQKTDRDGWALGAQVVALDLWGQDVRLESRYTTSMDPWWDRQEGFLQWELPWIGPYPVLFRGAIVQTEAWNLEGWQEKSTRIESEWRGSVLRRHQMWVRLDAQRTDPDGVPGWTPEWVSGGSLGWKADARQGKSWPRGGWMGELGVGHYRASGSQSQGAADPWHQQLLHDLQFWWTPEALHSKWTWQNGAYGRWRRGQVPYVWLSRVGGPNSLHAYSAGVLPLATSEVLAQSEWQWHLYEPKSFRVPGLGWNLFSGLDAVTGVQGAWLVPWEESASQTKIHVEGQFEAGLYGGLHLLVPGFLKLRAELGWNPNRSPVFWIGLSDKVLAQRWARR